MAGNYEFKDNNGTRLSIEPDEIMGRPALRIQLGDECIMLHFEQALILDIALATMVHNLAHRR
jgi:hypothetical protein